MRNKILYLILILAGCSWSCDSYLETKEYGQVLPETTEDYASLLYTHLNNIETSGSEKILGNFADVLRFECFSDNMNASLQQTRPNSYTPIYVGSYVGSAFYRSNNLYQVVKDVNIVLDNVNVDESELSRKVTALAYTLRGILYYDLMRELCEPYDAAHETEILGMPVVDHFDMEAKPGRGNIRNLKNFIIGNFQNAIRLNMEDKTYLLTADVAKAYLARTCFWGQDWKEAAAYAQELLDKYPLVEGEEYKAMIQSVPPLKELPGNVILSSYTKGTQSYAFKNRYTKDSRCRPVSFELVDLFRERDRDIRYNLFFDKKFLNTKRLNNFVRGAEMCLILAESYAHMGDEAKALSYLNLLRSKRISGYTPLTMNSLPPVNPEAMIKVDATGASLTPLMSAILDERRKEFYMEGDRWFELKRNGRPEFWVGNNGIKYTTEKYLYTYPLWKLDLQVNPKLVQNKGYENL